MPLLGSNGSLPLHSSAVREKEQLQRSINNSPWFSPVFVAIPGVSTRRLRVLVPSLRLRRQRGPLLVCFACLAIVFTVILVSRRVGRRGEQPSEEPSTLVFHQEDLQRIWNWEIASGHYPSADSIPWQIGLQNSPSNPALPPQSRRPSIPSEIRPSPLPSSIPDTYTHGFGPKRTYIDIQSTPPNVSYPPRPVPGSVADLDVIMKHCDFSQGKYVRDCLEVLRMGAGLDNGRRTRRGPIDDWKYIYLEDAHTSPAPTSSEEDAVERLSPERTANPDVDLVRKRGAKWEAAVHLPPTLTHHPSASLPEPCDPENPRVFHMFWTGPFTDKPYLALLSFLFTQNTGLGESHDAPVSSTVCRPKFWMWINPGPAAAIPNPNAMHDMFEQLKQSPWASPFLHPRFHDVIQFKLWNTTEQLDGIPEIKDEWRELQKTLFNSGGHIINVPDVEEEEEEEEEDDMESVVSHSTTKKVADKDDMLHRTGSKSSNEYDRLSVILSDMARFVLCHRFGGVYLDADTILLRDWEELWGWKGAFAYRWSRLEKYNTAVLRMNKGSALGTFLFRTALRNGLDFHPMTVSRYTKDAYLEGLLLRLPDALFDAAWLNTEYYQRDRPPQPYFTEFSDFFDTPEQNSASPQALGFDGFFKGSYSYHFHNFWWKPFDPARNWPDLGPQFLAGENKARQALESAASSAAAAAASTASTSTSTSTVTGPPPRELSVNEKDKRDLDWAAVLKRTFESYIRGERSSMYGEWLTW
ncbi:glycosyltransferase family 32 protein [Roridomyces roridus]|uniref:Glycosyltransferase family 32 protein n=1 Tax=Roridomyces roridus TaxID=1738132 RepID=A0AAD7FN31_9AGAR|nr:glycosyltransferase family 32 protein [Roridomyces roridus]